MSGSPAVVMRLVASAYTVAEKAGAIVRKVLHSGELGIVEKVRYVYYWHLNHRTSTVAYSLSHMDTLNSVLTLGRIV